MKKIKSLINHMLEDSQCFIENYKNDQDNILSITSSLPIKLNISSIANSFLVTVTTSNTKKHELIIENVLDFQDIIENIYETIDRDLYLRNQKNLSFFIETKKMCLEYLKGNGLPSHLNVKEEKQLKNGRDKITIKDSNTQFLSQLIVEKIESVNHLNAITLLYLTAREEEGSLFTANINITIPYLSLKNYPMLNAFIPKQLNITNNEHQFLEEILASSPSMGNILTKINLEHDLPQHYIHNKPKL